MAGEYTAKIRDYSNIIKSNNIVNMNGEVIEVHPKCLENIAMDFINLEEQKKEKIINIMQMKQEQTEFQQALLDHCGNFYFDFYKRFGNLEGQYVFRFLYLCTFMNYDNLVITDNGKKLYKAKDLRDIFYNLKKNDFFNTKRYMLENDLILFDEKKNIIINSKYCKRGKINKTKSIEVIRVFDNAIKELYEKSKPNEHKKLALLIKILPYISFKFNILCKNPSCEIITEVERFKSMSELCELVGYDKSNSTRLKNDLFKLRVNEELVIGIFETDYGKSILVNPLVYYKGTRLEDMQGLIDMFSKTK